MCKFHIKYFFFLLLAGVPHCISSAQSNKKLSVTDAIDSLKTILKTQRDDTNKVYTLNRLSENLKIFGNYDSSLSYAEKGEILAEKIGFEEGVAESFKIIGTIYYAQGNFYGDFKYQLKSFALYQKLGNKQGMAFTLTNLGLVYWKQGNYSKALEYDFKALGIVQEIGDKNTIAKDLCNIGIIYDESYNYSKALEYYFKALNKAQEIGNKSTIANNLGNIGIVYAEEGNDTTALQYLFKAVKIHIEIGNKDDISNDISNIGDVYYEQGNYAQALKYDLKALQLVKEIGDKDGVASLLSNLGKINIKLKKFEKAKLLFDTSLNISKNIGDKNQIKNTYYNLAVIDSTTGNYIASNEEYKKYIIYRDSIMNEESVKKITQMELSHEFEKREDSIRMDQEKANIIKTSEIRRKNIITNSAIIIALLVLLLAILLIHQQQIKRKKDKLIFEKEANLLLMEKQRMEDELTNTKITLDNYVKNMVEKNRLLEEFKVELENIKVLKAKEIDENRVERLEHLNKTTILTEDDWNKFKELFEQVHKGFFIRLKEKMPDLTQAEIRFICLSKLKLDIKQMERILGVSFNTIKSLRHRLRKKLGLSEKDNLYDISDSI